MMTYDFSYSHINSKANITELNRFYTQTITNSLVDNSYNKPYVDMTFNKHYNIAGVSSLLANEVDNTSNVYYGKTRRNNTLFNSDKSYYKFMIHLMTATISQRLMLYMHLQEEF